MAAEFTKQKRLNPNRSLGRSIVGHLGFNSHDSNMLAEYGQTKPPVSGVGTWLDSGKETKKQHELTLMYTNGNDCVTSLTANAADRHGDIRNLLTINPSALFSSSEADTVIAVCPKAKARVR